MKMLRHLHLLYALASLLFSASSTVAQGTNQELRIFHVRAFGAKADGNALDTDAINKAIEAASAAGGGQVLFTPGKYLSGTIHLKSHVALEISSGATIIGTTNLDLYAQPGVPSTMPEARWGKWHRALFLGENVENVAIGGTGTIDGNKVFDPTGEERMRGPHTILFVNSRKFTIRDLNIINSANYAVLFYVSDDVDLTNLKITGGWDGIHFRGSPDRYCTNVNIVACKFYTGDDSIAGRYWDKTVISDCIINSSCNGIRVIGPAKGLVINQSLFYGPGLQPHRTSKEKNRTNMLSGIILQPGAWDATHGPLDDVLISDNVMHNVASPVTVWIKTNNTVGRVVVNGLRATGVYRSGISAESWAQTPITNIVLRDLQVELTGGGKAEQTHQPVRGPGVDARPLPGWAFYGRNVEQVLMEDVRFSLEKADDRAVIYADGVKQLTMDNVRFPKNNNVAQPLFTTNGSSINLR